MQGLRADAQTEEDAMSEEVTTPGERTAQSRLRRLALSLLAGGGATAATLAGPLSGAVAADPRIVPPSSGVGATSGTASTSSESSSSSAQQSSSTSAETTSVATTSVEGTVSASQTSASSTTGAAAGEGARAPATTTTSRTRRQGEGGASQGREGRPSRRPPRVRVRRRARPQQGSGGTRSLHPRPSSNSAGSAHGSGNVAPAPQVVAPHTNLLAALTKGVAVSAQSIDLFYQVPPFLLPIYQAAAVQYGVPWEVLAAINEVETDYGNDLSVSSAGAIGWMQFMPATWLQYGVDALNAGYADPYNPVDAIFAAARYLAAAGAAKNLRTAVFAYNHSEEYVESVLLRARLLASYPPAAVATLTGLSEGVAPLRGAHLIPASLNSAAFGTPQQSNGAGSPTAGAAPAPAPAARAATSRSQGAGGGLNQSSPLPQPGQLVELEGDPGAPVVASQSGRIIAIGQAQPFGRYLVLEDVYGDIFTYAGLGSIAPRYRLNRGEEGSAPTSAQVGASTAQSTGAPQGPASAGSQPPVTLKVHGAPHAAAALGATEAEEAPGSSSGTGKVLLYARPRNPDARAVEARLRSRAAIAGGWQPLRVGSVVTQGTVLGAAAPSANPGGGTLLRFAVRPAGDSAAVNPEPILQNWDQLQRALHPQGARGGAGLLGSTADAVFLLSPSQLERAVLSEPGIALPACARADIAAGRADARVLATLLFLSRSGLRPTVAALRCGSAQFLGAGASEVVRQGIGVDISQLNGTPVAEHQGAGTVTDLAIRTLLTLQGRFAPARIISLMRYPGAPSTRAQASHAGYIEVDFAPSVFSARASTSGTVAHSAGPGPTAPSPLAASLGIKSAVVLSASQWSKLIERIASIQQPQVPVRRSSAALPDRTGSTGKR